MKRIIVASQNPVKLNAALEAFQKMFADEQFEVAGVSVASGVSDQPMNDNETLQGAINRAQNAQAAEPEADFWVGMEGGIELKNDEMESFAWMAIRSNDGRSGKSRTGTYFLAPRVAELIQQGKELGDADDIVFGKTNSKQANGATGLLTGDVVTRAEFYEQALCCALIPFKNPDLYPFDK